MTDQPTGDASERPEDASPTPPPPPAEGSASAPTPPPAGGTSYDAAAARATLQQANRLDLAIIGAGVVAWLAGFMPFYTASVSAAGLGGASNSGTAYHGFFGWFALWVALAAAGVLAASLFGVSLPVPVRQVVTGAFGLALVCLVLALFIFPGGGCPDTSGLGFSCDTGRGFGFWLALLAVLAGLGLSVVRMRETTASGAAA